MASKAKVASKASGIRPTSSRGAAAASAANIKGKKGAKAPPAKQLKKSKEFAVPAFSICLKPHAVVDFAELRKKTARRQAPQGENKVELAKIIKSLKGQKILVEEFINLVAPFTADQCECFRSVLGEELDSFRKLARKIYETMTSDVSDVLVNEHVQITSYYEERRQVMHEKMMKMINEIHEMAHDFDFGRYMTGRQEYLSMILPVPANVNKTDEEIEMHRRQQAYHRLQWLRMEGERLGEENRRLKAKLDSLKLEQKAEIERTEQVKEEAEAKKQHLEEVEAQAKTTLEKLNESVEKSLIENEAILREQKVEEIKVMEKQVKTGAIKKVVGPKKKTKKRPAWVNEVAQDMETQAAQEAIQVHISDAATKRLQRGKRDKPKEPTSPFHYSPPRWGEESSGAAQETAISGFCGTTGGGYSQAGASGFSGGAGACPPGFCGTAGGPFQFPPPPEMISTPQMVETNIQQTTTTVQQQRTPPQQQQQQRRGRGLAPRDTWGGFG